MARTPTHTGSTVAITRTIGGFAAPARALSGPLQLDTMPGDAQARPFSCEGSKPMPANHGKEPTP